MDATITIVRKSPESAGPPVALLLSRLLRRRTTDPKAGVFTVYSRAGCGCCTKALDLLKKYQRKYHFTIDIVDIDTDPALVEAYGESVPVIAIDGKVRFRGLVNPVLLERLLQVQKRL